MKCDGNVFQPVEGCWLWAEGGASWLSLAAAFVLTSVWDTLTEDTFPSHTRTALHPCCKGDEFPKFTYSNLSDASLSRGSLSKKQIVLCLSLFSINRFNVSFQNQLIWLGYTLSVVHLDMEGDPSSIIFCPFALLCCTYCKYPLRRMADFSVYRTIIRGYLCW